MHRQARSTSLNLRKDIIVAGAQRVEHGLDRIDDRRFSAPTSSRQKQSTRSRHRAINVEEWAFAESFGSTASIAVSHPR
jgi:hypothetical protein